MYSTKPTIKLLSAAAAIALMAAAGAPAEAQYYKGKTLTLLVGFGPGSGVTSTARVFARHFGKHIPGNPNVIVKNLPGAGSVKATNFVYEKAKPNGFTVIFGPLFPFNEIISAPGVRFKFCNFTYIGGAFAAERVRFMRRDAVPGGAKTLVRIVNDRGIAVANDTHAFDLHMIAPVLANGWVLLGDLERYVSVSSRRFASVAASEAWTVARSSSRLGGGRTLSL